MTDAPPTKRWRMQPSTLRLLGWVTLAPAVSSLISRRGLNTDRPLMSILLPIGFLAFFFYLRWLAKRREAELVAERAAHTATPASPSEGQPPTQT